MTDHQALPTDLDQLPGPVADVVRTAEVILVPVDDGGDEAVGRARRTAVSLAALAGARVVLLDRSDTTYADTPRIFELSRDEVVSIGDRQYLLDAIDEATDAGVSASAFQHSLPGDEAISDAAERSGADLLVVPEHLGTSGLLSRLKGGDASDRATQAAPAGTAVVAVDADGALAVHRGR